MALSDLKAKLAAVATAVKTSVATVATERIEKAKARAAEKAARAEKAKERKYFLDAIPGTKEEKERRLGEIEQATVEYSEICKLEEEAEIEYLRACRVGSAGSELATNAKAVWDEIRSEKERIEADPDVAFFGWHRQLESMTETPDRRTAIKEIDKAITAGFLREITVEAATKIQEAAKAAKEEGRQYEGERHPPFFWLRVKPRGDTLQGEQEPNDHFRYISGGSDFYERSVAGARKRLVFFAMQDLWKACTEAKKAAYEAAQDVKQHSHLTLADIAAGQTGQAWAEVTADKPWEPVKFNRETNQVERRMKNGKEVVNYGPVVVESPRPGVLRVLNVVNSGMFYPLRFAGAWEEQDGKFTPVEFKFFAGNHPRTGKPNNFAGLKPVKGTVDLSPGKLGQLRAILCLAAGLQAPAKEERTNGSASEASPETPRGYRSDGSKAGEARSDRASKKKGRRNTDEEAPEVPRNVRSLADAEEQQ